MTISTNEVIRCAVRQRSASGTDIVNVYHLKNTGGNACSESQLLNAAATHYDNMWASLNAQIPSGQTPLDIKIDVVELIGGIVTIVRNVGSISWGSSYAPSGGGESYALGVAIGLILRTLVGKVFGRKSIGQVSEVTVNGNALATGTPTSAFTTHAAANVADMTVATTAFTPGILSTRTLAFEEFEEADIAPEVFYQRRRAIRAGS